MLRRWIAVLCSTAFVAAAAAQLDINGPNVGLRVNGAAPNSVDPIGHDVMVPVPGILDLRIETAQNPGGVMMLSSVAPLAAGNVVATPWGGSIDVGSPGAADVVVLTDGIGGTGGLFGIVSTSTLPAMGAGAAAFALPITVPAAAEGFRTAVQGLGVDPTQPPFFLDNTAAADLNFFLGTTVVTSPTGLSTYVPFVDGRVFPFHGGVYSGVWVNGDGFVHFEDNGGPQFGPGATSPTGPYPSIAVCVTEWAANAVFVQQAGNSVVVEWGRPSVSALSHAGLTDTNRISLLMELDDPAAPSPLAGRFATRLDSLGLGQGLLASGSGLMGHLPGTLLSAPGAVMQVSAADQSLAVPQTSGPGEAQIHEHARDASSVPVYGYDGLGGRRYVNDLVAWNGSGIEFAPIAGAGPVGAAGYTSTPLGVVPDSATQLLDPILDANGGNVTIVGRFHGFDDPNGVSGDVAITPRGGGLLVPTTVLGVLDGAGTVASPLAHDESQSPLRNGEGLVVSVPAMASGPIDVVVTFASGLIETIPAFVAPAGAIRTSLSPDSLFGAQHSLQPGLTISYGGTAYTELFVSPSGIITFGDQTIPSFPPAFALTLIFDGFVDLNSSMGAVPGVAVAWMSMYRYLENSRMEVIEDVADGTVRVSFSNVYHPIGASAGTFAVTFGAAGATSVEFDHAGFRPDEGPLPSSIVVGLSDGSPGGVDVNAFTLGGLTAMIGGYVGGGSEAIGEVVSVDAPLALATVNGTGIWTAIDIGVPGPYSWILL